MKKEQVLAKLRECGLVAVVRAKDADDARRIAEACIKGGCAGIELTYTTPGVNAIIELMAKEYDGTDFVIGAGTVMDPETARMAILSGAQYVVSPYFNADTVRLCNRYRVACMPGAMSITEVVSGMEAGADIIKVPRRAVRAQGHQGHPRPHSPGGDHAHRRRVCGQRGGVDPRRRRGRGGRRQPDRRGQDRRLRQDHRDRQDLCGEDQGGPGRLRREGGAA